MVGAYRTIRAELDGYGNGLAEKIEILCLSKIDALTPEEVAAKRKKLKRAAKAEVHAISAVAQRGLEPILYAVLGLVTERRAAARDEAAAAHAAV